MPDFLSFWEELIQYVRGDKWLSGRSLKDLSDREWQRLGQHFNKDPNEPKKSAAKQAKEDSRTDYQKEIDRKREEAKNKKPE